MASSELAKIIGITPVIKTLIGIWVACPPYIFLPTTLFAYCTGILLSPSVSVTTNTTIAMAIITNSTKNIGLDFPAFTRATDWAISIGNLETIPAKIKIEIPFPIPCSVICSPIHTSTEVPATIDRIIVIYSIALVALIACLNRPKV